MLNKLLPLVAVAITVLLMIGCSKDATESDATNDANAFNVASGETESVPSGGGLLNIEFEGKFYPGVFTYEDDDSIETLDIREDGSVVVTSLDEEDVPTTQSASWGRIYDGISISVRAEGGGEPIVTFYQGLGQDDLLAKGSKKIYLRQAVDESDGEDAAADDDDAE